MYSNLESVEQLFRQYYKVLRVYAFRFVNDWDVAEDIVQDVFVALWNKEGIYTKQKLRPEGKGDCCSARSVTQDCRKVFDPCSVGVAYPS